jgi:hypothetical protein
MGGEAKFSAVVELSSESEHFISVQNIASLELCSDPLLKAGYLDSYPRNPFVRSGYALHQVQSDLTSSIYGVDPLRNGTEEGRIRGTRFGADCTTMGSVLADPRTRGSGAWADVEYEFWDMWVEDKPKSWLPGMFFYKGIGPEVFIGAEYKETDTSSKPILPTEIDQYIMGVYGGIRTKGKDILGEEQPLKFLIAGTEESIQEDEKVIWPMTRSEVSDDPNDRSGCPFGNVRRVFPNSEQQDYGNPNGIRDAIILVLTAGEDYSSDR